jgi:hypothetical protein
VVLIISRNIIEARIVAISENLVKKMISRFSLKKAETNLIIRNKRKTAEKVIRILSNELPLNNNSYILSYIIEKDIVT